MTNYRSALVTGASSGIGAEIARVLAARGTSLTLVARRADRLTALAEELSAKVTVRVEAADLNVEDDIVRIEQMLIDSPVELLINNAGVGTGGTFHELPIEAEVAEINLNIVALVRLTHAALPSMVTAGKGGVVNISSMAGEQPLRGSATYSATKAFVTAFSEAIAGEVRGTGVNITIVKPGFAFTDMTAEWSPDESSFAGKYLWLQADQIARDAIDAVEKGRLICVPGLAWKSMHSIVQSSPHALVRAFSTRMDAL